MNHTRLIKIIIHCMSVACIWASFYYDCLASSKRNIESYELIEENFSKGDEIDVKGLYKHIHYEFQNETLLREALHPRPLTFHLSLETNRIPKEKKK